MFSESAELYDLIYSSLKDYEAESARLAELIRATHPQARHVLDVACGTAEHARLLSARHGFQVDGLDLDPGMLRIASRKLPSGRFYEADMTAFAVPGRYDVILCLFSSIGYVRTLANVRRALERFRAHLAPGGVVLVEPWFPPGVLQDGRTSVDLVEQDGLRVCRMSHVALEGTLSRLRFEYLIGRAAGIEHAAETHELGLFTQEEMTESFRAEGYHVAYDPAGLAGRGLYTGRVA